MFPTKIGSLFLIVFPKLVDGLHKEGNSFVENGLSKRQFKNYLNRYILFFYVSQTFSF